MHTAPSLSRHRTALLCLELPWLVLLCLGLASLARPLHAQTVYGTLVGVVRDSSGAAIPGATVSLQNRDTNLTLTAITNETGSYTIANVLPGPYDVKVALLGFKEFTRTNVDISAAAIVRVDVALQVGALTEIVTVQSEAALLQTDKADTHTEFNAKEITDLPLADYRNYQSLLDLVPGSTPAEFQNAEIDTPARSLRTTINGTNPNNNSTRVDGATNQFTWLPHHTLYVAPAETIQSVNVTTSSFDADQGLAGGAAVSVITKSGTNQIKGSAFGFYTDERLRARSHFAKRDNLPKLPSNHHIDGFTLGGPIVKNKVFYFGAFEGQYRDTETERIVSVPTEAMRRGDLSSGTRVIYDPLTGDIDGRGRTPFQGNQIPADRLDPIAQRILSYYPLPNRPGNTSNYLHRYTSTFNRNQYDLKVNWNRSSSHQLWAKMGMMDSEVSNLFKIGFDGGGLGTTRTWVAAVGHTLTLSPTLVIDGTFGYSLLDQFGHGPDYGVNYGSDVLGIPGTNGPDIRQSGFPEFVTGFEVIGSPEDWQPYERYDPSWSVATNVTRIAGRHQIRFGGAVDRQHLNHWQPEVGEGPRGYFQFSGNLTALRGSTAPNFYNTFSTFLLGLTSNAQKTLQWEPMSTREWRFGLYVNDRWQVNNRLTVNAGVRWEYYPLVQRDGRGVERLDFESMEVLLGGVGDVPSNVGIRTRATDFAPRAGVAYRLNDRTVARAGYGLTYNPLPFARPLRGFYPLTVANSYVSLNSWQPFGRLADGIPDFAGPPANESHVPLPDQTIMRTPDPDNVHRGSIQSWNVAIERRLPWHLSLTTSYVGTKTSRGYADREMNWSGPGGGESGRQFFDEFGRTASTFLWGGWTRANYHSLQIALDRRMNAGLFLKGAYTYGKAMNMADDDGWVELTFDSPSQFARNYAPAGFDRSHNFSIAYVYQLPFGQNGARSILAALVKDWQVNGTFQAYTGTPFTVTASNTALNQRGDQQTADLVSDPEWLGPSSEHPLYDPAAWANVTQVRYGDTGRNSIRGPGRWLYHMSLFRTFPLSQRMRLQFRLEGFSLTNHPQWGNPESGDVTSANFMRYISVGGARNVRVGLRLSF